MKINELISQFTIYLTNEEQAVLEQLQKPAALGSFTEHDQFVIEGLIRKSLVIRIGSTNPQVVANDL